MSTSVPSKPSTPTAGRQRRRPAPAASSKRPPPEREIVDLTGNLAEDGLDRYQLDFLETAEWVKDVLLKMKNDAPTLAEKKQKAPFVPEPSRIFTYHTTTTFDFDFTIPHHQHASGPDRSVTVSFRVSDAVAHLGLSKEQHHKLLLLVAGVAPRGPESESDRPNLQPGALEKIAQEAERKTVSYDVDTDTATITCDTFAFKGQNKKWLSDTVDRLIEEAKDTTDAFADIPIDVRLLESKAVQPGPTKRVASRKVATFKNSFPKTWNRPVDVLRVET
ncbi:hypothetical protein M427DRAFT_38421 [Gonapodya prolifera JEL478]|uniref:Small ribosomal subunit protein mS35 mitochondrial conserved domain-containing protein n=1 Tax=Gonapodya prolifera (strain JEL478) TaxID=1344416 RepID=A0A138ZZ51_GONPJ|nr:hypothetical protein M427DRAFT_38421 [Gonapodya prolifera JEL478]|eukprot:KXS09787.1 hypothetical protein M427DRAFT_38421 [Gonapodya prolifera JEL478]